MSVFTAGITSSMATSQYGLSSTLSSPSPSTDTKQKKGSQRFSGYFDIFKCPFLTVHGGTWFETKGGAKARPVVEAPAFLDLPGAGGFWDIFLAGRAANARARRQRWGFIPNGLGWTGIVHPDPISEAHFTADSEVKTLSHRRTKELSRTPQ